jgi:hypothetical protein
VSKSQLDAASPPRDAPWRDRALGKAEALVANPVFAYGAVLLLELRVVWDVWRYRDTSFGDTADYFLYALEWSRHLTVDIVWSPLYTAYFGTIVWFVRDVHSAVMVHRILIVLTATMLVLALGRALLGPALGLLVAAWWAVNPGSFDFDYEVHLFGFIPVLIAALLLTRATSPRARGVAVSVLLGAALLIRNELLIPTAIFALGIVSYEVRRRHVERLPALGYLRAYGAPILVVCLLTAVAVWQSPAHGGQARAGLRYKEKVNICEAFAFNYQQRYPDRFTGNPFTQCTPLMQRLFGRAMPTLYQEVTANPRAVADFVKWNGTLLPSGIQVALFGATSTGLNPGYLPVEMHRLYALMLSILALVIVGLGLAVISRTRARWKSELRPRMWTATLLTLIALTAMYVALTQRPRAEYIYGLTLALMMLIALCVGAILWHISGAGLVAATALLLTVMLTFAVPSYYRSTGPRRIHDALDRLEVVRPQLQRPGAVLVTSGYNAEICKYLAKNISRHCTSPSWAIPRSAVAHGKSLVRALDDVKATVIYADAPLRADPAFGGLLHPQRGSKWRALAFGSGNGGEWSVLVRRQP